jgi:hypothetical protein
MLEEPPDDDPPPELEAPPSSPVPESSLVPAPPPDDEPPPELEAPLDPLLEAPLELPLEPDPELDPLDPPEPPDELLLPSLPPCVGLPELSGLAAHAARTTKGERRTDRRPQGFMLKTLPFRAPAWRRTLRS